MAKDTRKPAARRLPRGERVSRVSRTARIALIGGMQIMGRGRLWFGVTAHSQVEEEAGRQNSI